MKQRPILVAVIGYIIGILWGLYFQFSMVLFDILMLATYYIVKNILRNHKKRKFKLLSIRRYSRYLKLIVNTKVILILIIFSLISNGIVLYQDNQYETTYQDGANLQEVGIVVSQKIEKQYYDVYQVKLVKAKPFCLSIQVSKKSKELEYGDKVKVKGEYKKPSEQRNYGGYDDGDYLKTLKVIGRMKVEEVEVLAKGQVNPILQLANQINLKIKEKIDNHFEKEEASILKGILLGDTSQIEEEVKEDFQTSNISHILAISGMHVAYIVLGIQVLSQKVLGKRKTKRIVIVLIVFYALVTGSSPSVVRAVGMAVLSMGAGLLYRKNDTWNTIAISLLGILLYNPFLILNVGLQLSYIGTIGIILFHSTFLKILKFIKREKIKEIIAVSLSAQVAILPILVYHFNKIGIYFLMTNLFVSFIIGPIMIMGFLSLMNNWLVIPVNIGIEILNGISNFAQLPFTKIYIVTPSILSIVFYFITIIVFQQIYQICHSKYRITTQQRVRNLMALFCYRFRQKKKKYIKFMIMFFVLMLIFNFWPRNLKIYFVDVGQGDATFMVTPQRKTILVDGGGSVSKDFDVGKKTLLPYLLDRGYKKVDYVIISHFDQDHVRFYSIFITRNKSKKCDNRKTV